MTPAQGGNQESASGEEADLDSVGNGQSSSGSPHGGRASGEAAVTSTRGMSPTPRDRVLAALSRREPDRVPIDFGSARTTGIVAGAYEALRAHLGLDSPTRHWDWTSGRVVPDDTLLQRFSVDTRRLPLQPPVIRGPEHRPLPGYVDSWGVTWHLTTDGRYYVHRPPLVDAASLSDLRAHPWPDPDDPAHIEGLADRARALRQSTDCAIVMDLPGRVFSQGQHLCGLEEWLVRLLVDPGFAGALLDQVVEIESQMVRRMLQAVGDNVDVVLCPDDLGMQSNLLMSPDLYRRVVKPRHRRLFDVIKRHTKAKLLLHSDGAVAPLLGDFVDLGVDAFNPIQVSAAGMGDTARLKREFGRDLCFWGAIDTQRVLPFGTVHEVAAEVRRRIEDLAPGGGYVLAAVHNVQAEVRPENICAMFEAALEYGWYGLR